VQREVDLSILTASRHEHIVRVRHFHRCQRIRHERQVGELARGLKQINIEKGDIIVVRTESGRLMLCSTMEWS
jgi:hypothetical protein